MQLLVCAGLGLSTYYDGSWRIKEFKEDVYRTLEKTIKNDLKAVINAVKLLSRTGVKEKVKNLSSHQK